MNDTIVLYSYLDPDVGRVYVDDLDIARLERGRMDQ